MTTIEASNGSVEFAPSPDHVNLIAEADDDGAEVRLNEDDKYALYTALRKDEKTDIELVDGIVSWEPARGLYVENYGGSSLYVILTPEEREQAAEALSATQIGH